MLRSPVALPYRGGNWPLVLLSLTCLPYDLDLCLPKDRSLGRLTVPAGSQMCSDSMLMLFRRETSPGGSTGRERVSQVSVGNQISTAAAGAPSNARCREFWNRNIMASGGPAAIEA